MGTCLCDMGKRKEVLVCFCHFLFMFPVALYQPKEGVGMANRKTTLLVFAALGVCLNMVGSFLSMSFRLPVYMDNLGTVFVSLLCGPIYGISSAMLSSICNSVFDPFALPFLPNGVTTALFASLLRCRSLANRSIFIRTFVVALPTAIVSASISAYIFGGITSATSSYIVQFLYGAMHLPLIASAFLVQIGTDYLDKFIILMIVGIIIKRIPSNIKEKI